MREISRARFQFFIKGGLVSINGVTIVDPDYRLQYKELVEIKDEEAKAKLPNLSPDHDVDFAVLYEDEDLLVLDKPAGVVVHAGAGNYDHTLVNGLIAHCEKLSGGSDEYRPGIVHRIDKDTSGILVVAKNDATHAFLAEQFAIHSITRKYICFCYGVPNFASGKFESKIGRDKYNRLKMSVVSDVANYGKNAITIYKVLEKFSIFAAKIECELKTGRTHQIRVHFSHANHALIGDQLYRPKNRPAKLQHLEFPRQALHAYFLEFTHPRFKRRMQFASPLPQDLIELEKNLKKLV